MAGFSRIVNGFDTLTFWTTLGIEPTTDRKAVKKAYSVLLKSCRPDQDPEGYQVLRAAFDEATAYCRQHRDRAEAPEVEPSHRSLTDELTHDDGLAEASSRALNADAGPDETYFVPTAEPAHDESSLGGAKHLAEQRAFDAANQAYQQLFDNGEHGATMDVFNLLVHSQALLNLKTRSIFEAKCLETLVNWPDDIAYPLALVAGAAAEFQWFSSQQRDYYSSQQVAYLEARVSVHGQYQEQIVKRLARPPNASPEYVAVKLLTGRYRPIYFHLYRFASNYNGVLRQLTQYFAPAIDEQLCPELDTPTFHWWARELERCLFSAVHVALAAAIVFIVASVMSDATADLNRLIYFSACAGVVAGLSVIVWLVHYIFLFARRWYLLHWVRVREKRLTDIVLSVVFVVSVSLWRSAETGILAWAGIVVAMLAAVMLFNFFGAIFTLLAALIFVFFFEGMNMEVLAPQWKSYALIAGFISHKMWLNLMQFLPRRINIYISETPILLYLSSFFVASACAYGVLSLVKITSGV